MMKADFPFKIFLTVTKFKDKEDPRESTSYLDGNLLYSVNYDWLDKQTR